MSKQLSDDSIVIEVYLDKRNSLFIDQIDFVTPHTIQIGIGKNRNLPLLKGIIQSIIDGSPNIKSIVLPEQIPTYMISFLSPLMEIDVDHYYVSDGKTGFDVGAYDIIPGYLPDEINLCHRQDNDISGNNDMKEIQQPTIQQKPVSINAKRYDSYIISDGFIPLDDDQDQSNDGFFPEAEDGSLDDIVDGFHEIPVEKRSMWEEDPARMNRLSYVPIANILQEDTFPESLGGGSIR